VKLAEGAIEPMQSEHIQPEKESSLAEEVQRIRAIQQSMEKDARPVFDDEDIEDLRILIRLAVEFYDYLMSIPPWPQFLDPFHERTYVIESLLYNVDSFHKIVHLYDILVGSIQSTIDWSTFEVSSLKDKYVVIYRAFVKELVFETKCRLLLDLIKLQIVFAGLYYDCRA
jgi:hypothetical protein